MLGQGSLLSIILSSFSSHTSINHPFFHHQYLPLYLLFYLAYKVSSISCSSNTFPSSLIKSVEIYCLHFLKLQFTFNNILYWFQMNSIVPRQSSAFQSVPPDTPSTHQARYLVTTTLLTLFPVLCFTCLWLFCNYQFVLINLFTSFTQCPTNYQCSLCFNFVLQIPHKNEVVWYLSFSNWLASLSLIPSWSIQNTNSKEYTHPSVHCSIIYNRQDMESTQVTTHRWVNEKAVANQYTLLTFLCFTQGSWSWVVLFGSWEKNHSSFM